MSAAVAAAAAASLAKRRNSANTSASTTTTATPKYNYKSYTNNYHFPIPPLQPRRSLGRYELQKSQDWDTFDQYLKSHHHHHHHGLPPVSMLRCSGSHVVEFLRYLDQFGETKIHNKSCAFFGQVYATAACSCPLKQAWTSLDAVVSRLRSAFEEHGGAPENNPFGSPAVWLYLRQVKEFQAKARGEPFG